MEITFYGTRGSIPTPGPDTAIYGGNTACTFFCDGDSELILDAGTGIRLLSDHFISQTTPIHILLSHHHWDHIQGFPFFSPIYQPERDIHIYVPDTQPTHFDAILKQMDLSYFPVNYQALQSNITLHQIDTTSLEINGFVITPIEINHPNGGYGYIIEKNNKRAAYVTDNELFTHAHLKTQYSQWLHHLEAMDCLIHDAQYTQNDLVSKIDWGHSSIEQSLTLAQSAKVKKLFLYSHAPEHSDNKIKRLNEQLRQQYPSLDFEFAREGMTFKV